MATKKYSKRYARRSFKRVRRTQRGGSNGLKQRGPDAPKPPKPKKQSHVQDTQISNYVLQKGYTPIAQVKLPFPTINAGPAAPANLRVVRALQSRQSNLAAKIERLRQTPQSNQRNAELNQLRKERDMVPMSESHAKMIRDFSEGEQFSNNPNNILKTHTYSEITKKNHHFSKNYCKK